MEILMLLKKNKKTLEELIIQNNNILFVDINEVKVADAKEPHFKLFVMDQSKKREIKVFKELDEINFFEVVRFLAELQISYKNLSLLYEVNPLMPQYKSLLNDKLKKSLSNYVNIVDINETIKDIDEEKIGKLTVHQQNSLFIDLCCCGNAAPLKKLINFSAFSESGTAYDIEHAKLPNKSDVIFGLERATSYGHLDVVKSILDNDNFKKIIDFSDKNSDLLTVLTLAATKERKEIISYIMVQKEYKLSEQELNNFRFNAKEASFAEIIYSYENKYQLSSSKPKL